MMNSQRSDTEKINLNEKGKKIGIYEVINTMKLLIHAQSNKYKTMSSYYLKCRKMQET